MSFQGGHVFPLFQHDDTIRIVAINIRRVEMQPGSVLTWGIMLLMRAIRLSTLSGYALSVPTSWTRPVVSGSGIGNPPLRAFTALCRNRQARILANPALSERKCCETLRRVSCMDTIGRFEPLLAHERPSSSSLASVWHKHSAVSGNGKRSQRARGLQQALMPLLRQNIHDVAHPCQQMAGLGP